MAALTARRSPQDISESRGNGVEVMFFKAGEWVRCVG